MVNSDIAYKPPPGPSGRVTKVLIVDDHVLFRQGLVNMLEKQPDFNVVGEAGTRGEVVEMCQRLKPDQLLLDIDLPDGNGLEAIPEVLAGSPHTRVVLLTVFESEEYLFTALAAGAKGYIHKTMSINGLLTALRAVQRDEPALSRSMVGRIIQEFSRLSANRKAEEMPTEAQKLSQREIEVLELLGLDLSNREIANKLFISEFTVKIHVHQILHKLHLNNRREAGNYARHKLLRLQNRTQY